MGFYGFCGKSTFLFVESIQHFCIIDETFWKSGNRFPVCAVDCTTSEQIFEQWRCVVQEDTNRGIPPPDTENRLQINVRFYQVFAMLTAWTTSEQRKPTSNNYHSEQVNSWGTREEPVRTAADYYHWSKSEPRKTTDKTYPWSNEEAVEKSRKVTLWTVEEVSSTSTLATLTAAPCLLLWADNYSMRTCACCGSFSCVMWSVFSIAGTPSAMLAGVSLRPRSRSEWLYKTVQILFQSVTRYTLTVKILALSITRYT